MTARYLVKKKNMPPIGPSLCRRHLKRVKQPTSLASPASGLPPLAPLSPVILHHFMKSPKKSPSLRDGNLNLAPLNEPSLNLFKSGSISDKEKKNPLLYNKYTNNSSRLLVSPKSSSGKIKRDYLPASKCVLVGMPNKLIPIKKHSPVSTQEWDNSIYAYNKKNTILLPSIDKMVIKLIKSYFNSYLAAVRGLNHSSELELSVYSKTYVSKPEIKHTNSKVIITIYRYMVNKDIEAREDIGAKEIGRKHIIPCRIVELKIEAEEKK
jgi:hypothetical protein